MTEWDGTPTCDNCPASVGEGARAAIVGGRAGVMEWFPKSPDTLRDMNSNDNDQLTLALAEERERLTELKAKRDAISDKLMAVTLDGDDPVTHADYQKMLDRERRMDNRIWATRQVIRELKAAGAR